MRIPQTAERIKEAPAQALRAVFAGVGQVLLIGERVRRRAVGDGQETGVAPGTVDAEDKTSAAKETRTETPAAKETAVKAPTAKPAGTETPAAKETAVKAPAAKPAGTETPAADSTASVLPVPHYSELSIASLRARLRGLDVAQVRELIRYERAHEDRANVIAMFERRIAKLEEAGGGDATKG